MATARDICNAAGREIGVFAAGEAMPADDATDAMATLNRWIDSNAAERLQIYTITRSTLGIIANQPAYLLGEVSDYDESVSDGFDTPWNAAPPEWTATLTGTSSVTNDDAVFQAGGHSIRLDTATGTAAVARDFVVAAGVDTTLIVYAVALLGSPTAATVTLQCVESGDFLNVTGVWQVASTNLITVLNSSPPGPPPSSFLAYTRQFTTEPESVIGSPTATLRITLYMADGGAGSEAWFDTFSLTAESNIVSIPRPVALFPGNVRLIRTDVDPELEVDLTMLTEEQWQGLTAKDLESTQPTHWYYNPTFPFGTLTFWPVPIGSDLSFAVYAPTQVPQFGTLDDVVSLPPGYERMLVKNLALELAPSYKVQPSGLLMKQAAESLATVKRANIREVDMKFPAGSLIGNGGRIYNIRTG